MKNLFILARLCLYNADIEIKLQTTHQAMRLYQAGQLDFERGQTPLPIEHIQFPKRPELLAPRNMAQRSFNSASGIAAFFHAIAHIEFIAIHLAWDILYRFRGMPEMFYVDWLHIAEEEAQHFCLIREHLLKRGVEYGDLPAHQGLWDHAQKTADDLLARLAIVPRCQEARGLDVTPSMIGKCKKAGDEQGAEILTRILVDEQGHVERGTYWFKYICNLLGLNSEYMYKKLIIKYLKVKPKGPFNREMRINAGFSESELKWLET